MWHYSEEKQISLELFAFYYLRFSAWECFMITGLIKGKNILYKFYVVQCCYPLHIKTVNNSQILTTYFFSVAMEYDFS